MADGNLTQGKIVLNNRDIERILKELSEQIHKDIPEKNKLAVIGVQTRGVELSRRLKQHIEKLSGESIKSGILDITFHRDDLTTRGVLPEIKETRIEFEINDMIVLLVDDVIFSGRSTKAALETLMTFGRPKKIKLFVLIDRGNRDLPIQPDYCGHKVSTKLADNIQVILRDTDHVEDTVLIIEGD